MSEGLQKLLQALRIPTLAVFTLGCFAVLLFIWVSFGGPIPMKAEQYQLQVDFQDAATLAENADVRIAGVNIGKVRKKELNTGGAATRVTLEIEPKFAPLPADTRAILRQKSLLGETFVELSPGSPGADKLEDGERLARGQVEPTTQLDEILTVFDEPTKKAFRAWVRDTARTVEDGGGEDVNDALGNVSSFAEDGADIFGVLDKQGGALRLLVSNTGVVFGALNERNGQLRELIENSHRTFEVTARERDALAETFAVLPTFLDESRQTLDRLETFSRSTEPLVRDLQPVADDLAPTIRDIAALSPDLEALFRDLRPLIDIAPRALPDAQRLLRGASPVFDGLRAFLPELNPILSYANFNQTVLAGFVSNPSIAVNNLLADNGDGIPDYVLPQFGVINETSLSVNQTRPEYDRGNSYLEPNAYRRGSALGILESFDCKPSGQIREPRDGVPPCYVKPPSLWGETQFPNLGRGDDPVIQSPGASSLAGTRPARP